MCIAASLDGFVADTDGGMDWLESLPDTGEILMLLDDDFSRQFGWVNDRFGVSGHS